MVQPGLYRDSIIKLGLAGDTKKYVRKYARKTPSGNIPSQNPPFEPGCISRRLRCCCRPPPGAQPTASLLCVLCVPIRCRHTPHLAAFIIIPETRPHRILVHVVKKAGPFQVPCNLGFPGFSGLSVGLARRTLQGFRQSSVQG